MKFSNNWLQTFFDTPLPAPEELAQEITFHSSEIEEVSPLPSGDTMLDVKVLPDRSAWLMSHRGLAKEVSVILDRPLKSDLFKSDKLKEVASERIHISRATPVCDYYGAALVEGVTVGPSPEWLKLALETIGQRSINNIVDATNYVMFELGQPLHAFAADKLGNKDGSYAITVRQATAGEKIVSLTGETYELSIDETVIVDATSDSLIGIAGIKGGKRAAVTEATTAIVIESAHFERVAIRQSAKRLKLPTDAAKRFENGISVGVSPLALRRVTELICEIAGGNCTATSISGDSTVTRMPVSTTLKKINSVLGLSLSTEDVSGIIKRFGFDFSWVRETITVTPSFERDDIVIAEDLIEEVGRIHGLHHIESVPPSLQTVAEFNARHYYAEKIRAALIPLGFSEIYTSSFRNHDEVKLENALATDKGYLRSSLVLNMKEAKERNVSHRDLLGLSAVKLFEIGTVFGVETEEFRVVLGVQTGTTYKAKHDDALLNEALTALEGALGIAPTLLSNSEGVAEFSLDGILKQLPAPSSYELVMPKESQKYQPFSIFPALSRDIALFVEEGTDPQAVVAILNKAAGPLRVRTTQFDEFHKDGRVSLAFRLVFQAPDRTLTDTDAEAAMNAVYEAAKNAGFEVR
jgi:phenylalanyl-tRNA synthetase beta chain